MPTAYDHQEQSDKDKQPNTLARSTTDWRSARHQSQVAPGSYLNWKRLMARGLLPVRTASAHWIRDVRFEAAIADFLTREGTGIEAYADELRERSPFRKPSPEAV